MRIEAVETSEAYHNISRVPTSDYSRPGVGSSMPPTPSGSDMVDGESGEWQSSFEPETELVQNIIEETGETSSETANPQQQAQQQDCGNCTICSERVSAMGQADFSEGAGEIVGDIDVSAPEVENVEAEVVSEGRSGEGPDGLSEEERREVQQLRQTDQEVRQHEQAHVAAGGQHVRGGPRYDYTYGPDGQRYAVGGSVDIDSSEEPESEQTEKKMRQVRAAAMAPANPSPADHQVAQKAARKESEARLERMEEEREEREGDDEDNPVEGPDQAAQNIEDIYGNEDSEEESENTGIIAGVEQAISGAAAWAGESGGITASAVEGGVNLLA